MVVRVMTAGAPRVTAPALRKGQEQNPKPLAVSVRKSAVWSMSSTILLRLASIGVTAVVARILTPQDFGVFAVATTVYTIVSALGEFGVGSCLSRADLDVDALAPTMWSVSLVTSSIVAAIMVLFAKPIASSLGSADGAGPVRVMAITMILIGVTAVPTAQCTREYKQGKIFLANVISFFPSTIVLFVLAKSGDGAMAFAWSRIAGQFTSCVVMLASAGRLYVPGLTRYAFGVLLKFGLPWAGANFVGYILQNVDYAFIGHLMGPATLGSYVVAFNAASWSSSLLFGVIYAVAIPTFSRVKEDPAKLADAMANGVRAIVLIAAPMCFLSMVLARPLVSTIYGARWSSSAAVLSVLSLYGLISVVCILFSNMIAALGKSNFILIVQLIWLAALVPAMAIGVREDGMVGAAVAHIIVLVPIVLPCYLIALKRAARVRLVNIMKAVSPSIISASVAAFIAWTAASVMHGSFFKLVAGLAAGGLFYMLATAPQLIFVFGNKYTHNPLVCRILRFYRITGRTIGIPVGPPPKHASAGPRPSSAPNTAPVTPRLQGHHRTPRPRRLPG